MSKEINFVSERRKRFSKTQKQDLLILRYTSGVVAVVFLVAMILTGASFYFRGQLETLEKQVASVKRELIQNEQVERSFVILIAKLKTIGTILDQRQDKQQALDYFTQLFGPNVLVKQIQYDDKARILSLRLESPDIFVLENIFEILDSPEVKKEYATVNKGELRRSDIGKYEVSLAIQVGELEEPKAKKTTQSK